MIKVKTNPMKYKDSNGNMIDVGGVIGKEVTDLTLTKSNVPADSKTVGDKLNKLSQEIVDLKDKAKGVPDVYAPSPQLPADGRKIGDNLGGGGTTPNFTNLIASDFSNCHLNKRWSVSSGAMSTANGYVLLDMIPVANGDVIRINLPADNFAKDYSKIMCYASNGTLLNDGYNAGNDPYINLDTSGDVAVYTNGTVNGGMPANLRISLYISSSAITTADLSDLIITKNEEITYTESEGELATENADFDAESITANDIYNYMDALVARFPAYITKEVLGSDESGTFDWCRYVCARKTYNAWLKNNYPAMYAWVNGSTVIYSLSVSPRIGDTLYSTAYVGTAKGTVTAVSNANQTRTVGGVVYTRDSSKDIEPTLVYTHAVYRPNHSVYWFATEASNKIYNASRTSLGNIASYTGEEITDSSGNTYIRYPLGDRNENFENMPVIVIGANEHGGQQNGDSAEPAIVTARMAKDLCECVNANNQLLNLLKSDYMVVFCPVINPYGFGKTNGYTNANGVNIDRNFDTPGWGNDTDTRHGDYGGSENETQYFMNTLVESKAKIAMANHSLGYTFDDTGNPQYMGVCAYMLSAERDKYTEYINAIRSVMNVNYDLLMHNMGEAPPESYAKTRSYIDWIGIEGVAVEMAVSDGTEVGGIGSLHTAKILEADYTLLLRFLHMLMVTQE